MIGWYILPLDTHTHTRRQNRWSGCHGNECKASIFRVRDFCTIYLWEWWNNGFLRIVTQCDGEEATSYWSSFVSISWITFEARNTFLPHSVISGHKRVTALDRLQSQGKIEKSCRLWVAVADIFVHVLVESVCVCVCVGERGTSFRIFEPQCVVVCSFWEVEWYTMLPGGKAVWV